MDKSLWGKYHKDIKTKEIKEDFKTDILIIGGGLSGISAAFYLENSKYKVAIIEQGKLLSGTTNFTTAKLTYLQDTMYQDIEKCYDKNVSNLYLKSQFYGIELIKENIKKYKIDCDFNEEDSYVFTNEKDNVKKIKNLQKFLDTNNIKYKIIDKLPNNYPIIYGIKVNNCYTFNPIKYAYALTCTFDNVDIYEHVRALEIKKGDDEYIIKTNKNIIKTKMVITATQYPFFIIPGLISFKTHLKKSHVIASETDKIYNFNAISIDKETISMRYYSDKKNYFIFGGESYKMSNHIDYLKRQQELDKKFKGIFNYKIAYRWATHDLVSNDYLPIIGSINGNNKNHYIITAFNAWGMINSALAGKIISDIINNRKNEYINLFNPSRPITLKRTLNFIDDTINFGKIYLKTKVNKNKKFYSDNVKIINIDGKSYGVYIDTLGKEHIVRNLCPHAKCSLIFNYQDKTWDCPCHGSRYDIDGNIIKGPSVKGLKKEP